MITYAQNFEDVMLSRLFQNQCRGFYVDLGAWHPTMHSVTKYFYDIGWSGINVEPVRGQYRLFVEERPRDDNLNLAVGDSSGCIKFYECVDLTSLSTASKQQAEKLLDAGHKIESYYVHIATLNEIAERCAGRTVDFLKIDVEGYESKVLAGADWRLFRPRVLVIEATVPAVPIKDWDRIDEIRNWDAWEPFLLEGGYVFAWFDGLSRFYLRKEEEYLKRRLSLPPCVHDDIHFFEVEQLRSDVSTLEADRVLKTETLERVVAELSAVQADRCVKADIVTRLSTELVAIKEDRETLCHTNEQLVSELSAVKADRCAKADAIREVLAEATAAKEERHILLERAGLLASQLAAINVEHRENVQLVEHLSLQNSLQQKTLVAKDEVIRAGAVRELQRKRLIAGFADLFWHARAKYTIPAYGKLLDAGEKRTGLNVALDVAEIVFGVSGGVESYMRMLVSALVVNNVNVVLLCLPDQLEALKSKFSQTVAYFVIHTTRAIQVSTQIAKSVFRKPARVTPAQAMTTYSRLAEDLGVQILHSPVQVFSALDFRVPSVLNLHDLQHLHFPENFRRSDIEARNYLYGLSTTLADAIIVSSDFVKNDTIDKMNVSASKVFTVPVTWDPMVERGLEIFSVDQARAQYQLPKNYAIYPAHFWPHKNHMRLIEALRIVRDRKPEADLKLVLTGFRGHSAWGMVEKTIDKLGLINDVICLDYVPVEHLAGLYKGAIFCVMPSVFEASSYPVIESQVLGVPVMCSNVTSLPELVCDGSGLLFDPFDPGDIAAKMIRWIEAPEERAEHVARAAIKVRREHSLRAYVEGLSEVYEFIQKGSDR